MSTLSPAVTLTSVQKILMDASGGEASAFAGLGLSGFTRDQFLAATIAGVPLIVLAKTGSCCSGGSTSVDQSGLLRGLRGVAPFDGSQFPRLPWGRPVMKPDDITAIAQWISDGLPEEEPQDTSFEIPSADLKRERTMQHVQAEVCEAPLEALTEATDAGNTYRYQNGDVRQRMNIDCMTESQLERLREAFAHAYSLNDWAEDARSYNNVALIHQNHCQHGWERFLPWHRIYLYEFEKVLQEFCPEVTLPYWDWTMPQYVPPTPAKGQIIPPALQGYITKASLPYLEEHGIPVAQLDSILGKRYPNQTAFFAAVTGCIGAQYTTGAYRERFIDALLAANALWYPLRYSGEFGGKTINQAIHYHYPTAEDVAQIMSLRTFRDFGGGSSYDDSFGFLDQNPHNTLHIWTGGINPLFGKTSATEAATHDRNKGVKVAGRRFHKKSDLYSQPQYGDMFSNLTASYDPVFWPIHVNIDRLWHDWQEMNPNNNPVELDSVLTPWSYTVRDTLEMKRFGYEYVRSSCLLPVGAETPVTRYVSSAIAVSQDTRNKFRVAEVRLHRVPQLPRSCFVRVFLNMDAADANTPLDAPGYAGYLAIFGHGDCIGGPGHCAVPQRGKYDLRPRSHNTPRNHRVDVSKAARKLFDAGATSLTITLVVVGADYEEERELFRMDGVSLNFLD